MLAKLLENKDGNYSVLTAVLMAPLLGAVALAVDYTDLTRHKAVTMHALDAAGLAAAREIADGKSDAAVKEYAKSFFEANLGPIDPKNINLAVHLPEGSEGPRILKLVADISYKPHFLPAFVSLLGNNVQDGTINIKADFESSVRLKNTSEIALVLDNSGSMAFKGAGTGETRLSLLQKAAKKLVENISNDAKQIKQLSKAAQFSVVPFASSVNVGPGNSSADWMDRDGISSIHHENFDWDTLTDPNKTYEIVSGVHYKKGSGWGDQEGDKLTRFSLFNDLQRITGTKQVRYTERVCKKRRKNGSCRRWENEIHTKTENIYGNYASWAGCVEARPYPWNVDDTVPSAGKSDTLFVPMFAPDEADGADAYNSWWTDGEGASWAHKQENMSKYFTPAPNGTAKAAAATGPNLSCTTQPITPLEDTTRQAGLDKITGAIDAMKAEGGTNVTEGIAWGWRTLSSGKPFTEGRSERDKGNDKVIIVLTDGRNTYYTPKSLGYKDLGANKSIYSAYGYTKTGYGGKPEPRLFLGTSNNVSNAYLNDNYTVAMNEHMASVCGNAKSDNVMIFSVGLDLDPKDDADMIAALEACASESKIRKGTKLFWNTKGNDLDEAFDAITDELSNLHIIG